MQQAIQEGRTFVCSECGCPLAELSDLRTDDPYPWFFEAFSRATDGTWAVGDRARRRIRRDRQLVNRRPMARHFQPDGSVGNQHKWARLGPEKIIIMKSCVGAP